MIEDLSPEPLGHRDSYSSVGVQQVASGSQAASWGPQPGQFYLSNCLSIYHFSPVQHSRVCSAVLTYLLLAAVLSTPASLYEGRTGHSLLLLCQLEHLDNRELENCPLHLQSAPSSLISHH